MSNMKRITEDDLDNVNIETLDEILFTFKPLKHGDTVEKVMDVVLRFIAARGIILSTDGVKYFICAGMGYQIEVATRSEAYQVALEIIVNREANS